MREVVRMHRRAFLVGIGGAGTMLGAPPWIGAALAQGGGTISPSDVQRRLAALETRARAVGLPEAPVAALRRRPSRLTRGNAYLESLPRLLDLMDRSELGRRSTEVGDGAAELLSQLHRQEYGWARVPGPGPDTRVQAPKLDAVRAEYRRMFDNCQVRAEYKGSVAWHVNRLRGQRVRYEGLGNEVKIPWYFIGIIHGLEAGFNFMGHLHNGDVPLTQRTRNVPKNRPEAWLPPSDWESSAKDALDFDGFLGQADWSLEAMLYRWEAYNGWGYRPRKNPTPYLWSFSNHYNRGKYASDGNYDPQLKSQQCGAAVMLKELLTGGDVAGL
jgi:lysozyme family protein